MSWSAKRQLFIIILLCLFIGIIGGVYYFLEIRVPISCTDGKKNQSELGVDCGGPCEAVCEEEIIDLSVEWVRPFKVVNGKYDVAALVVNKNNNLGIPKFKYRFSLFDSGGVHVSESEGEIFINPNEKAVVFVSGLNTGERDATKAIFEFENDKTRQGWKRIISSPSNIKLSVDNKKITEGPNPSLSAEIINSSPYDAKDINISTVVYDANGNAMAVSSTYISSLLKNSSQVIVFTWPEPFKNVPKSSDVLPRINNIFIQK